MSSSQFAQASAAPVRVGAADRDEAAELRLLGGVPAAGAGRDRPGRRRDDEHEYGDDQAVGQQGADDGAEVAGAADGAEVGADGLRRATRMSSCIRGSAATPLAKRQFERRGRISGNRPDLPQQRCSLTTLGAGRPERER